MTAQRTGGLSQDALSVDGVLGGELGPEDLRIHSDALRSQARTAETRGNANLAANLERAAELVSLDDQELLAIYDALRPRRSTMGELEAVAVRLEKRDALLNAELVREAAATYQRRGLLASS